MELSFWKFFGFFGAVSEWAAGALAPDVDGVVRITTVELADLADRMCNAFGWKAEIVVEK
jgi:hypothetical protein